MTTQCSVGNHIGVCGTCKLGITYPKSKPLFTKKHYKVIAEMFNLQFRSIKTNIHKKEREIERYELQSFLWTVLHELEKDSPVRFKREKFIKAIVIDKS